jgi:hypothetical protein
MSNINVEDGNDTKLGYEAGRIDVSIDFHHFQSVHKSKFTRWVGLKSIIPIALCIFSHSCACSRNMHKHSQTFNM